MILSPARKTTSPVEVTAKPPSVIACSGDQELTLENTEITTTELFVASGTLTAGPGVRILEEGDVTLRACGRVVLRDGFSVVGGRLTRGKRLTCSYSTAQRS